LANPQFAHKVVTYQPQIGRKSGTVCRPKTDILATERRHHAVTQT